jgi:hypothetical protein
MRCGQVHRHDDLVVTRLFDVAEKGEGDVKLIAFFEFRRETSSTKCIDCRFAGGARRIVQGDADEEPT